VNLDKWKYYIESDVNKINAYAATKLEIDKLYSVNNKRYIYVASNTDILDSIMNFLIDFLMTKLSYIVKEVESNKDVIPFIFSKSMSMCEIYTRYISCMIRSEYKEFLTISGFTYILDSLAYVDSPEMLDYTANMFSHIEITLECFIYFLNCEEF
jgi:hypothetical protein